MASLDKILRKGKAFILAYDQGLEHGPVEFNDKNVSPKQIIDIAKNSGVTALALQKGPAEKYRKEIKASKIPLILKLNGKTRMYKGEAFSPQLCTVEEAIKLGAAAVGYTIYFGSEEEWRMLEEFEAIEKKAHAKVLPVIVWSYPRGKSLEKQLKTQKGKNEIMAYAARAAFEVGADMVKIQYSGDPKALKWAVKSADRCKVVISGGVKEGEKAFLKDLKDIMNAGASGMAIGRNIWQHDNPREITKKVSKIIWGRSKK